MSENTNPIMVSVICNAYNHERYIGKTIESILMQKTSFAFEILIHDDASTDRTAEMIKQYEIEHPDLIKAVFQTENQYSRGVQFLHKYQYSRARGKYLAFCEGDDFWIDDRKLEKQVDFLEKNSEYIACVHKYIVVDEEGNTQNIKTFGYYEDEGRYELNDIQQKELPSQLASLVCRNIILSQRAPYPKEFFTVAYQEDLKFFLYLLSYGPIYRMEDTMSAYRFVQKLGGNSWSSRQLGKPQNYKSYEAIVKLERVYRKIYNRNIDFAIRKKTYAYGILRDMKNYPSFKSLINAARIIAVRPQVIADVLEKIKKYK